MRVLVTYSMLSGFTSTTRDYVCSFGEHLPKCSYLHVTAEAICDVDLAEYDVVINSYCARFCYGGISETYQRSLRRFKGVKVLILQDEYTRTNATKEAIADLGFDLVLTCVPSDGIEYVYPRSEFPNTRFETVLTGYVPDRFKTMPSRPLRERTTVVGYRGRNISPQYGRLAFEKMEIGRRMREICVKRGVPCDIEFDESSRIYGDAWYDFIGSCRAILATESGSNVFDFDGSLETKVEKLRGQGALTFEQFTPYIGNRESKIDMGQISPRIFECAAMRTPMVLFRGRYSDIVKPDQHYIPLEKDFSNIDDVFSRLADFGALEEMTERVHAQLIMSEKYSYRHFVKKIVSLIEQCGTEQRKTPSRTLLKQNQSEEDLIERCGGDRGRISSGSMLAANKSERERLLTERPTKRPKTPQDFDILQLRLNFVFLRDEIARLTAAQDDAISVLRPRLAEIRKRIVDGVIELEEADIEVKSFENACAEHADQIALYLELSHSSMASLTEMFRVRYEEIVRRLPRLYIMTDLLTDRPSNFRKIVRHLLRALPSPIKSALKKSARIRSFASRLGL